MLAVLLAGTFESPHAKLGEATEPKEEAGRVLVEVAAAGVTKMEPHWITGWRTSDGAPRAGPITLGCEFAGWAVENSDDSTGGARRRRVVGMTGQYHKGAMAQRVSARAGDVLPLPDSIGFEDAATLPLAGLTAWQALVRYGELQRGQKVLIHGGAGGVGTFAVQIARWIGARVVATAAAKDAALCRELGADEVIDFEHDRFEDHGHDYDLVFDQIGGDVQERSWGVLKRGGGLITIAGEETDAPDQGRAQALGIQARFFIVDRNAEELGRLLDLVIAGEIHPVIGRRFGPADIEEAFDGRSGSFPGKPVFLLPAHQST